MARRKLFLSLAAIGAMVCVSGTASASEAGLYGYKGHRIVHYQHHAPRHGGPNEDSFMVTQDDRRVVACYDATYYPAKYRVDPQGHYVRGAKYRMVRDGNHWMKRRRAPVYVETRTRIKEDYVSLRPVHCR